MVLATSWGGGPARPAELCGYIDNALVLNVETSRLSIVFSIVTEDEHG